MQQPVPASSSITDARRWTILATSLLAAMATTCLASGVAFLIPRLHRDGMSLPAASILAAAPMVGMVATTVLWGWALDRIGERRILLISLSLTVVATVATTVAAAAQAPAWGLWLGLFAGGAVAASTNGASGRIVVGWFPAQQRGTAMGIRQMAQPLGVGVTGLTVPVLAHRYGVTAGFAVFAVVAVLALAATALWITDPDRTGSTADGNGENPYRRGGFLVRVHAVSVLLVVPQIALWTFVPAWLIIARGWPPFQAGAVVTATQVLAALGRIAAGRWSDAWGSRMRPIRVIAAAAALLMAALAATDAIGSPLAVLIMVGASIVVVADNGLAFTAIAEYAGPAWSGRGLGIQNTAQYVVSAAAVPIIAAVIDGHGYAWAYALCAVAPLIALALVPRDPR
ncbi:putative major facilitator superfamily transporter [Gordonia araii NBRC 100433]|uniref:Putative major facilitator superfamily transporter n=1 Tax=Gordonia araii NBRC 100433 TaxID=1073574 RepID=G7H4D4_9ACTN|nr:MFS transporter [Gordonia araii]GAB10709.1 putative major facilitator superfamily transporter [Gordonia araii NBRC 100433]